MMTIQALGIKNNKIKHRLIDMYKQANAGHIGSSLSACELLTFIKFYMMQPEEQLILSKGHSAALLYSILMESGDIDEHLKSTFYKNNTTLPAHPPVNKFKAIPFATGSLGHGLGLATGIALANSLKKNNLKTYCVLSDGELDEGSTWEAILFIQHHNLRNLVWFVDRNYLQGFGRTEDVIKLDPLDKKFEAFGFVVHSVSNAHDFAALIEMSKHLSNDKMHVIIAHTIKGNGWTRKNTLASHYLPFTNEEYNQMLNDLK